jgi:hypothetical protein
MPSASRKRSPKPSETNDWLWVQVPSDKDKWMTSHIPDGEVMAVQIKQSSRNSDGSHTFFVYRNARYIDCSNDLNEAKRIAYKGVMRTDRLLGIQKVRDYIKNTPGDPVAFKKLDENQRQSITDVYPHLVPRKSELAKAGVKPPVNSARKDLMSKNERAAEGLPMAAVIKVVKDTNPKKEGSDAHVRWALLFQHGGKTVGDFIAGHGNPTTLKNAVKAGYVKVEGL